MARYGQRPENALKRANEFIEVGKQARALDTLYEVFKNKKWVFSWSENVLEPIMFKYLDLCVELKKSHIAKEGLFQYRNMFQSVNVSSLESVIRFYLKSAEDRTEQAREQSQQAVVDIDDLDNLATPESLLLSAVSGEDAQDRSDRTILTPWVKFLWESYCQCLELLRTNTHVETLYHDIARMAFSFCLKYNRKTEFRKLCDKLRKHLEDIQKLTPQVANVSISKPETQQLNQDTRLVQLDSAIQMELWQEAYKAIEDIHGLMNLSKKSPVPKTMANYYQKLALVFYKAGQYLFHAAALFKLFQLSKEMKKNITAEELQKMACRVLIATLAIPLPSAHPEFDRFIETDKSPLEKAQRLAVLLGLFQPPTRKSLLRDIAKLNVVNLASSHLQDLFDILENQFVPLELCSKVENIIGIIETEESYAHLVPYIPALKDVTLIRLIRQVSQVYQTVEFPRLVTLCRFSDEFHIERILVDCVRHNDMQILIDHRSNCIHFGMDLSQSQREDKAEGPTLQTMPSEQIRTQVINMCTVIRQASSIIDPQKRKLEQEKLKAHLVQIYHDNKVKEHRDILARRQIIEDRKEYLERMNSVREEEEARRQEEYQRQQMIAEQKRLNQEREERERKRQENEIQQIKDRHLKEKMQEISRTTHGQRILKKLEEDDLKKMDADEIAAREVEELQKERRELQQKLKSQEKKVDYYERAKRLEEIPLLQKAFEDKKEQDMKFWEQQEKERIEQMIEERKLAVQTRERLSRMFIEKDVFTATIADKRENDFKELMENFKKDLDNERVKMLASRKEQRKEERRNKWLQKKAEEAERKQREREAALAEQERIRREAEEEAERIRKQKEQEEYQKKKEALDRQAEIQREREREIEERYKATLTDQTNIKKPTSSSWRSGITRGPPENTTRLATTGRDSPREITREVPKPEGKPEGRTMDIDWRAGNAGAGGGGGTRQPEEKSDPWRSSRTGGITPSSKGEPPRSSWRGSEKPEDDRPRGMYDRRDDRDMRRDDRDRRGDDRDIRRDDRDRRGDDRDIRRDDRDIRRDDRDRRDMRRDDRDRDMRRGGGGGGMGGERDRRDDGEKWRRSAPAPRSDEPSKWRSQREPEKSQPEEEDSSWERVKRK